MPTDNATLLGGPMSGLAASAVEYMMDASQRSVLFLDVLRQRGDQYREHVAQTAPHVLQYAAELIIDGRKLDEPVNYALVRIIPPQDVEIDLDRRPFIVVDPRAGHGPGIGGFKADSEIGVAMKAGHPCYFIGFLPEPMPGQTIERIARAEAVFIETVISRHPAADGKPCVIGNCQAGWAVMILASLRPELFGPIIVAGAPLAYWAGVHGKYPMRYAGGLLGGSWLTALTSDLGGGKFDGAWLVQNFESQNPSNTLWTKQYNVYSKVDTEADRYLEFERWWGGHVNLNAEEIQFIVDELFVGNNLAAYQKYLQPWIKGMVKPQVAEMMRNLHPLRLQYEAFSSRNPLMSAVKSLAERVSEERKQVSTDNPFVAFQEQVSKQIVNALDSWRDSQEALSEATFLAVYGSPALQAAVGIDPQSTPSRRQEMSAAHREMLQRRIAELKSRISEGGLREAAIRGLLYVGSARGMVDERSLEALRNVRRSDSGARLTLTEFKMLVREQFFMLLLDQEGALAAIPKLLPDNA
jgi:pimeloyl-ACP methyl ester carboxylesterase